MKRNIHFKNDHTSITACSYDQTTITEPYLVNAFQKTAQYLLELDADRLMAGFLETAGQPSTAQRYPGWESTEIQGHTLGHYLTALSQAYCSTSDEVYGSRVRHICKTMKEAQREDGYLFASQEEIFDRVEQHQPAWVPWYTFHKILSGFLAAYELTGNEDAFIIAQKMGDWVHHRAMGWSEEVHQEVLSVEYGGMNDALYELYRITENKDYFEAAHQFDEEELFQKLYEGKDILNNLHANTTIPKILGALKRYQITGEEFYYTVAEHFWTMVIEHHTYITGGNSEWEHFGEPDILDGERTACNCETCNVHNMLKLSKLLYCCSKQKRYMDFYERAWTNAILSSQNPDTGMTMYFQPMETGMFKVYQDPFSDFWCCTGTGMENFTKLQDALFFRNETTVFITRYVSCRSRISELGISIDMAVDFPQTDRIRIDAVTDEGSQIQLALRIPEWTDGVSLVIDGKTCIPQIEHGFLFCTVSGSTEILLHFQPTIKAHPLPDNPHAAAFTYGPLVLCAALGTADLKITTTGVQVKVPTRQEMIKDYLVLESDTPEEWLNHISHNLIRSGQESELCFTLKGTDEDAHLTFTPYFYQHTERYGIYWTLYQKDSAELTKRLSEQDHSKRIEDLALDIIPIGNDQYELAHHIQGEHTEVTRDLGYNARQINGIGYFQYEMAALPEGCTLAVTYAGADAGHEFDLYINDQLLIHEHLTEADETLYTKCYAISAKLLNGKQNMTVTFRTASEAAACRVFQVLYVCDPHETEEE